VESTAALTSVLSSKHFTVSTGPGKLFHPAKVLENGRQNPEFTSGVILVGVTQITGCKVNRHGPSLLFSKYDHSPMKKTTFPNEKVIFSLDMPHFLQ
jgi:hypothetical protein